MKNTLILGLLVVANAISGCTVNLGTESNSAPSENRTATNTATAPKKEEAASTKKTDSAPPAETKSAGTRVQFPKGETSTSVTKDIPAKGSIDFLMNVQKGQTMEYTVGYDFNDSDIEAFLAEPGAQGVAQFAGPKEPKEFLVKQSGDHRLTVSNTTNKKVTVTLYLLVE